MHSLLLACLALLALAMPALAADGALEINQACAVNTGCFAGDGPGFPVTIFGNGSFQLTSNLELPNPNTDGIVVGTDDVGIDLKSFLIFGGTKCSGVPLTCTGLGTGSGVRVADPTLNGLSVKNGSITGMGNSGVVAGEQAEVTNLRIRSNGSTGLISRDASTVAGNIVAQNASHGILAGLGSTISGNTASNNSSVGIFGSGSSTISGNTVHDNGNAGIITGSGSTLSGNTAGAVIGGVDAGANVINGVVTPTP